MKSKGKGWSVERRRAQAERIKNQKPWEKSTGPKTPGGKDAVKYNAMTHGFCSAEVKALSKMLSAQAAFVRNFMKNL